MSKTLEALEAFEELRSNLSKTFVISDVANEKFDLIEKSLKALQIIKENLNIDEILLAVKGVCKASEYDLVKEVLL